MSPDVTSLDGSILGPKSQRGAFLHYSSDRSSSTHADPQQPWIPLLALTTYSTRHDLSPSSSPLQHPAFTPVLKIATILQQRIALQSPQLPHRHFSPSTLFVDVALDRYQLPRQLLIPTPLWSSNAYHVIVKRP